MAPPNMHHRKYWLRAWRPSRMPHWVSVGMWAQDWDEEPTEDRAKATLTTRDNQKFKRTWVQSRGVLGKAAMVTAVLAPGAWFQAILLGWMEIMHIPLQLFWTVTIACNGKLDRKIHISHYFQIATFPDWTCFLSDGKDLTRESLAYHCSMFLGAKELCHPFKHRSRLCKGSVTLGSVRVELRNSRDLWKLSNLFLSA